MKKLIFFVSILLVIVTACTSSKPTEPPLASLTTENSRSLPPVDCPVTITKAANFKAPKPLSADAPWPGIFWFGSEYLWTALSTDGIWEDLPRNPHGYTQKIMWWSTLFSLRDEPEPALVVFGKRLDAEAPALKAYGATNASAADIGDAMLTGVDFPTEGCWEVTGQYKKSGLTFVVWIAP